MTSTSPSDNRQQPASEPTQNGSDEGQAVTLTTSYSASRAVRRR